MFESLERRDLLAADLLQDINQTPNTDNLPSQMSAVVEFQGQGYFIDASAGQGTNLRRTTSSAVDGSLTSSTIVKQLDGLIQPIDFHATVVGQQLFFTARNNNELKLWRTDGTDAGTWALTSLQTADMFAFNNKLYFSGYDAATGIELWTSDGTVAGTTLLQDSIPGPVGGGVANFSQLGSHLLFIAGDSTSTRVWSLDNTNHILLLSTQVIPQSTFTTYGSIALFSGAVDGGDSQLWRTDGTVAGTIPYIDIVPGDELSIASAVVNNYVIVSTTSNSQLTLSAIDSSGNRTELLTRASSGQVYAAPAIGSKVLLSFIHGTAPELLVVDTSGPAPTVSSVILPNSRFETDLFQAIAWNNSWYFSAFVDLNTSFNRDMSRLDATSLNLTVLDVDPLDGNAGSPVASSAGVYWADLSFLQPTVLRFTADGTTTQTVTPQFLSTYQAVRNVTELNDQIVFAGVGLDGSALRLVNSDLTTTLLSPYQAAPTFSSMPIEVPPADYAGLRYFFANSASGPELWRTDGTSAGTLRIPSQVNPLIYARLVATTNGVFVVGSEQPGQVALWRIDDPANNDPQAVRGLTHLYNFPFTDGGAVTAIGDKIVIDGLNGGTRSFYVSDGTANGTGLFTSLAPFKEVLSPVVFNNRLYFSARDFSNNASVWRTDGTDAGTELISTDPNDAWLKATTDGSNIYWNTLNSPAEIYRSDDGLTSRTHIGQANVDRLAASAGVLYYSVRIQNDRMAIYRTDGSINPPELVTINDNATFPGVGLTPVPSGMLISGDVGNEYQVRLATLESPIAVQPQLNLFSSNLATYWGSPKLGSLAVGPVYFSDFGIEPATVPLAPQISLTNQVVQENQPAGVVGQLSTDWFQSTSPISYSLVAGTGSTDNSNFAVSSSGLLSANTTFDAEVQGVRTIRLRAANSSGTIVEQSLQIRIRDVFDGVELVELSNSRVAENSPNGTLVGNLSAQAPQGITVTYALVSVNGQTTNLPLAIVGNQLQVAGPLDFESQRSLQTVVRATGSNGSAVLETLNIVVTNVNENATAPISISTDSVAENAFFEGQLSIPGSTAAWTYSLIAGGGDYDNAAFVIVGNQLKAQETPDYETRDDYSVRVRASNGATIVEAALTILVTPVDEFDPQELLIINEFGRFNFATLMENIPSGEIAGRLQVVDADRGENYTFSGEFFGNELLAIVQGDLLISISPANYERDAFRSTGFVNATFGQKSIGSSGGASVSVIGDRNDPPIAVVPSLEQDVSTGGLNAFGLPNGIFSDEDAFDILTLSASYNAGPLPAWLSFNNALNEFAATPTSTDAGQYVITITATDRAGAQASSNLVLTVLTGQVIAIPSTPGNDNFTITSLGGPAGNWTVTRNGVNVFTGPFPIETPIQISDVGGNDTLVILASTGSNSIDIRGGRITLDGRRVLFDGIEAQTINGRGGNDTFTVISPGAAARAPQATGVSIVGGPGIDTLIGGGSDNLWSVTDANAGQLNSIRFSGIENLIGGSSGDRFAFNRRGSISGNIDGRSGENVLDFSNAISASSVAISSLALKSGSASGLGSFANIQEVIASATAGGRITGPATQFSSSGVEWQVSRTDGLVFTSQVALIGLRGFSEYRGGPSADIFRIMDAENVVQIDGGGGDNSIIYSNLTTPAVVDLQLRTATGVRRVSNIQSFLNFQGGGEVRGLNENTSWQFDSQSSQVTTSQGFKFTNFAAFFGGTANDNFVVSYENFPPATVSGGGGLDSLQINGASGDSSRWFLQSPGTGVVSLELRAVSTAFAGIENLITNSSTDYIDFESLPTREWFRTISSPVGNVTWITYPSIADVPIQLNLQTRSASGIRRFEGGINFISQTSLSTLIGRNANVQWQVDTTYALVDDGITTAQGFSTILAGTGNDQFSFVTSDPQILNGPFRIDGGEGRNSLNFGAYNMGVTIDLQTGNASMMPEGIKNFVDVIGSPYDDVITGNLQNNWLYGFDGNDILRGQQGDDVLLGGTGDDMLYGGSGNDLLLGGSGQDWLYGGTGDDLLISGRSFTLVDENVSSGIQLAALQAIMNEWTSGRSYSNRISRLRAGVGPGGSVQLNNTTITSDAELDRVYGEAGDDWFWLGSEDLAPDINASRERRN